MSVLKDFYTVNSLENIARRKFVAKISLNKDHDIFKGHFPGNPVTPGVCMMQIVKDLCETITNSKLFLISASNVKFMAIINPEENPDLILELEISKNKNEIKAKNTTYFGETIALKLSVNYQKIRL